MVEESASIHLTEGMSMKKSKLILVDYELNREGFFRWFLSKNPRKPMPTGHYNFKLGKDETLKDFWVDERDL